MDAAFLHAFIPWGGGGLTCGIVVAVRASRPGCRLYAASVSVDNPPREEDTRSPLSFLAVGGRGAFTVRIQPLQPTAARIPGCGHSEVTKPAAAAELFRFDRDKVDDIDPKGDWKKDVAKAPPGKKDKEQADSP